MSRKHRRQPQRIAEGNGHAVSTAAVVSPSSQPSEFDPARIVWDAFRVHELREAFGDYVDPLEYLRDTPGFYGGSAYGGYGSAGGGNLNDRNRGQLGPIFTTEQDLAVIRGNARLLCDVSVHAKGALRTLGSYVLGKGLRVAVKDRQKIRKPEDAGSDLARAADAIVTEFMARDKWEQKNREEELFTRLHRDGEIVPTLWPAGGGRADLRFQEPAALRAPTNARELEEGLGLEVPVDWSFGICTEAGDTETVLGYHFQWSENAADFSVLKPERVPYAKLNVDSCVKRGLSDFYPVHRYLDRVSKLLGNTLGGAAVLAAIAAIIEHPPGTTQSQVQNLQGTQAYDQYNKATPLGTKSQYVQKYGEATMLHVKNGQKYQSSPLANAGVAGAAVQIIQAGLRAVGANWNMPEFMISGDASNANYASTIVSQSPFVLFCYRRRQFVASCLRSIFWAVIRIAWEAGRFNVYGSPGWDELQSILEIQIEGDRIETQNTTEETAREESLQIAGLLSDRTRAARNGLDYEQELTNGAKAKEVQPAAYLPLPGPAVAPATDATAVPAVVPPAADGAAVATASSDQEVKVAADLVLNGAQIASALQIVLAVAGGELPRDTGLGQLEVLFNLTAEQALTIMGSAGTATPTTPNPKPPTAGDVGTALPTAVATESLRARIDKAAALLWGKGEGGEHDHA